MTLWKERNLSYMRTFFRRLCRSPIHLRVSVMLVALVWSNIAFGGEIHDAAKAGDLKKVKALLKDNPDLVFSKDPNPTGFNRDTMLGHDWTPLHVAAAYGHRDVAELLLANKADVDARDNAGTTPLEWAAVEGYKAVAALLLAKGANVNATNNLGQTPLYYATSEGNKNVAKLLRQHGGHE